jgi:hypothetical protein
MGKPWFPALSPGYEVDEEQHQPPPWSLDDVSGVDLYPRCRIVPLTWGILFYTTLSDS